MGYINDPDTWNKKSGSLPIAVHSCWIFTLCHAKSFWLRFASHLIW